LFSYEERGAWFDHVGTPDMICTIRTTDVKCNTLYVEVNEQKCYSTATLINKDIKKS